ncbi:hypothetical protein ACQP2F_12345 [Actinoplanes sp. CA-030573]|uniref:hypothetical protein n=1 Tax=Actinoplanes sp. CA-030573 TaxID=3239898 RepID=UPI003D943478
MKIRVVLVAVGAALLAYGIIGALTDADADPIGMAVFLLAVLFVHDLLWMPAVSLIARGCKKFARTRGRRGEYRDPSGTSRAGGRRRSDRE